MEPDPVLDTARMHDYLGRMQAGDQEAAGALIRAVGGRLERLARRMLRGFPNVRRWADSDDVLQGALVRLLRTLRAVKPAGTRDFVNLAAVHVRRELLDLARRFRHRVGAPGDEGTEEVPDPAAAGAADLDLWAAFHEQVERLPAEEREVVGLRFYHGWPPAQVAELFGVDERTVRRRWRSACLKLSEALGGRLPEA
jgi:RNA polymerase sigma-70 factor (ECF subfamily)